MKFGITKFAAVSATVLGLAMAAPTAMAGGSKDIVDTAVSVGSFETLAAALGAAGLVETLKGEGPFTVFAPTDEAFAKLPEGTVDTLLKPENKDQLTAVLTYHVVPGAVMAADVVKISEADTVNGAGIDIAVKDGTVMINNARVTAADVSASNGVSHVIDTVLLPPSN
ncbi:MAG: fasciclin domain-containing protein [Acuticoccus sp.]